MRIPCCIMFLLMASGSFSAAGDRFQPESLTGSWEGALVIGRDSMNLAFTFAFGENTWDATLISSGLGIYGMPAASVRVEGLEVIIRLPPLDAEFTGTLRLDAASGDILRIDGDWFQHSEMVPVVLLPVDAPSGFLR